MKRKQVVKNATSTPKGRSLKFGAIPGLGRVRGRLRAPVPTERHKILAAPTGPREATDPR